MSSKDLRISEAEHKTRIEKIRGEMRRSRIGALYLTNPTRIMYTTGFS
ncbi:aminopeptidase P family protein, partial [Candidatus Bathyarchaeota archaeon]